MGQQEIIELLEKVNKPLSRKQICEKLKEQGCKVSHTLQKLIKYKEVKFFEVDRENAAKLFGESYFHRRIRLYYVEKEIDL